MEDFTHPNITTLKMDVTSDEDVADVVKAVVGQEGYIDILVNNADGPCSDRKSTRLNSSHSGESRMPSSA